MLTDRFSQLVARQLSGEASEEELQELQVYLQEHPESNSFHELMSEFWQLNPPKEEDDVQQDIHFHQIMAIAENGSEKEKQKEKEEVYEDDEQTPASVFTMRRMLVAASFVGLMVLGYFVYSSMTSKPEPAKTMALNQVEAKKGIRSYLTLPDGTKVWLNSDSKLEYKDNFNGTIREVTLTGEAYFDVVRNEKRPFIVHTSDIDIKVLGTAFNVKSYPKEASIEATLIHGLIEITNKKEPTSPKVLLHPHEKLVFLKSCSTSADESADQIATTIKPFSVAPLPKNIADTSLAETSWVYNKLIFDGETFKEIAQKLERWYNVKINFKNEKVASIPIHYKLENETIDEALKAIQSIEDFTYKIEANEIEIY